jgi:hypothetical protein
MSSIQALACPEKGSRRPRRRLLAGSAAALAGLGALLIIPTGAFAANGTTSASILGGSLSVGSVGTMTALAPSIGATATGALASAQWADATGLGLGWNGTVAVSPLTYTGSWVAGANGGSASTALTSTAAGSFTDTVDGVAYTVKVTTATLAGVTVFSYTSTDTNDASGTGTATNGTATAVGTKGIKITFDTLGLYKVGDTYTVLAGTQSASGLTINTATATAISPTSTASPAPTYVNNGSVISAGSTVGTVNSLGAVKVLSAALGQGASDSGYYTAAPGVSITADTNSWAKTYSGSLVYSIVSGP